MDALLLSPKFTQQFQWQGKVSFEIDFLDNRTLKNLTMTKVIHLCHQNCKNIFVFFLHALFSLSIYTDTGSFLLNDQKLSATKDSKYHFLMLFLDLEVR